MGEETVYEVVHTCNGRLKIKKKKGKRKTGENQRALIKGTSFKDKPGVILELPHQLEHRNIFKLNKNQHSVNVTPRYWGVDTFSTHF